MRIVGVGVDAEFVTLFSAGSIVALAVDALAQVRILAGGGPGNHVIAIRRHRDVRRALVIGSGRIDQHLAALGCAGGIECTRINAEARTVLVLALPDHNKVAHIIHGHRRDHLVITCRDVDGNLAALQRAVRVEQLRVDAPARAILRITGPDDDVIAVRVSVDRLRDIARDQLVI